MKAILYSFLALSFVITSPAVAQQDTTDEKTMGLAERRILKSFQETTFPELTEQVNQAAGTKLDYSVNWNQLAEAGSSHLYEESWPQIYFDPLMKALKGITVDDMGKEAVQRGLEKVVIRNQEGCYSADCWANFTEGVLTLDHQLANVSDVNARAAALQEVLEKGL